MRRPDSWLSREVALQLVVFALVGGLFNLVYAGLYLALRTGLDAQWSNAVSLVLSTIAGTWGHRRLTFGVRGMAGFGGHQVLGLALLAFGLLVTAGSLWLLEASVAAPTRTAEVAVLVAANLGVGLVRFAAFRVAMLPFGRSADPGRRSDGPGAVSAAGGRRVPPPGEPTPSTAMPRT